MRVGRELPLISFPTHLPFLLEQASHLQGEEGIAGRSLGEGANQAFGARSLQAVFQELCQIAHRERLEPDHAHRSALLGPGCQGRQGHSGDDLVRPICTEDQQTVQPRLAQQEVQHLERHLVRPVEVVEDQEQSPVA